MKRIGWIMGILIVMILTGCSGSQVEPQDPVQGEATQETYAAPQGMQNAAEVTQLLFGTLMLEKTDLAVTPEQAAALLPLWKLYRSLLESDITASAEIEAVEKQLTRTMTSEQLTAMDNQTFDREQMNAIMQELGIDMLSGAGRGDGSEHPEGFAPPDGFQPGRGTGPGGGPGGGLEGAGVDPEMMATRQAEMQASGGLQRGVNLPLVQALIDLLEARSG